MVCTDEAWCGEERDGMRKGRQVPVMTEYGADSQTVSSQNEDVRQYWDQEACGTYKSVVGALPELSREWFASVEQHLSLIHISEPTRPY